MHYRGNGLPERKPEYRLGVIGICIALFACVFAAWGQDGQDEVYPAITRYDVWHSHPRHFGNDWWCEDGKWEQTEVPVSEDLANEVLDQLYGASGNWHIHYDGWDKNREYTGDLHERHSQNRSGGYDCSGYVAPVTPPFPTPQPRSPVNGCDPEPAPVGFTCDDLRVGTGEICHEWDFRESSFVGIPVLPEEIETIGELWNYFHDLTGREIDIKFLISGWLWQTYEGQGLGAIPITPHMGIAVNERTIGFIDSLIGIVGNQVQGEEITLEKPSGEPHRYHFVGFPEPPANYETFGDLLVRGVSHVRRRVVIDWRLDYQFIYTTSNEGADEVIQPGDAVVMLITREVTLDLSGSVAAAPSVRRKGTLATSWGAMKR